MNWSDDVELVATFRAEVDDRLASLRDGLLGLEADPAPRRRIDALMRDAHTVKGSGRMLGLDRLVGLAHRAEDLLGHVLHGRLPVSTDLVSLLLATADEVLALEPVVSPLKIGVAGFHAPGSAEAYEVRAFFPDGARSIEDPVTGSLNASLAQWLLAEGRLTTPYVATQGTRLGRTGRVTIDRDAAGRVWVGGASTVRVSGAVILPDPT